LKSVKRDSGKIGKYFDLSGARDYKKIMDRLICIFCGGEAELTGR